MYRDFLTKDERIDDLELDGLKIIQNKNWFSFGVDAVILSDMVEETKGELLDMCTGNAILPILLSKKTNASKIFGMEIQSDVYEMATRSIKLNNLSERITLLNVDIKNIDSSYFNRFEVITCNPPYFKSNAGVKSTNDIKMISRHEICCTLEDVILSAKKCLVNKGSFYIVHRTNRLVDIFSVARKHKLEPKVIRFVSSYVGSPSNLVLIKFIKGANPELKILEPLYIYNDDGTYSNEIIEIYSKNNIDIER